MALSHVTLKCLQDAEISTAHLPGQGSRKIACERLACLRCICPQGKVKVSAQKKQHPSVSIANYKVTVNAALEAQSAQRWNVRVRATDLGPLRQHP